MLSFLEDVCTCIKKFQCRLKVRHCVQLPCASFLDRLPSEVLERIFGYLEVIDIVRCRRLSRYFCDLTYSNQVWKDLYRHASFVRPPGPFPGQATAVLERALVTSFKVNRNLRRKRPAVKSPAVKTITPPVYDGWPGFIACRLVLGRWLVFRYKHEILCYDLDALEKGPCPSHAFPIYKTSDVIYGCYFGSTTDGDGHLTAYAVIYCESAPVFSVHKVEVDHSQKPSLRLIPVYSVDDFECSLVIIGPRVFRFPAPSESRMDPSQPRNPHGSTNVVDILMDTLLVLPPVRQTFDEVCPSCSLLALTAFRTSPGSIADSEPFDWIKASILSTSTHLVIPVYVSLDHSHTTSHTLILAFAIPPQNELPLGNVSLSMSHSSILPGNRLERAVLLQDSAVDPTGDVRIKCETYESNSFGWSARFPTAVFLCLRAAGTIELKRLRPLRPGPIILGDHIEPSWDGMGRIFCHCYTDPNISILEYDVTDNESEVNIEEVSAVLTLPKSRRTVREVVDYDQYTGRLCCSKRKGYYSTDVVVEIFDFAV